MFETDDEGAQPVTIALAVTKAGYKNYVRNYAISTVARFSTFIS
ncbi:MAG: hypothetical protein ACE5MM_03955 [Nitrospiraceae bacterium]